MIYLRMFGVWLSVWGGFLFQKPYSKAWDEKLSKMLDAGVEIEPYGGHNVKMQDVVIWTSNRWYAYATPYGCQLPERRPSIRTMIRFNDAVEKSLFK